MGNKIILLGGDPNSVNSEIIYKVWKKLKKNIRKKIYLLANYNLFSKQFKKLKYKIKIVNVKSLNEKYNSGNLKIIDIPLKFKNPFNVSEDNSAKYVLDSLKLGHILAVNKNVKGIINCAINKKLIKSSKKIGVTEFLASKCKIKKNSEVMMIYNKKFSVVPITTHINIKNVSNKLNKKMIVTKINTLNKSYKKLFNKKPQIGILGLNPHNSEMSKDSEEIKILLPAISLLKKKGLNIKGPLIADTVFINNYRKYNVIVGMYHDQVLAPFKALFNFDAINLTLGLSYIRVSPDHGPAIDLIGKKKASCRSLLQCVKFINNLH